MLIVGLGNPGKAYEKTRHNIGFMFVDYLAQAYNATFKINKQFKGMIAEVIIKGEKHYLLKPITYMNLSGESVIEVLNYYHLTNEDLMVISDDLSLAVGAMRIRKSGSSGGHKGLENIISNIHSSDFIRIRIGIGENINIDSKDYVLSKFSKADMKILTELIEQAPNIIEDYLNNDINFIMNKYNKKVKNDEIN